MDAITTLTIRVEPLPTPRTTNPPALVLVMMIKQ
jgi:hypothetical protein